MGNSQSFDAYGFSPEDIQILKKKFDNYQETKWNGLYRFMTGLKVETFQDFVKLSRTLTTGNAYDRQEFFLCSKMELTEFCVALVERAEKLLYHFPNSPKSSLHVYFGELITENQWDFVQLLSNSKHFKVLFQWVFKSELLNAPHLSLPEEMGAGLDEHSLITRDLFFLLDCAIEGDFPQKSWKLLYSVERDGKSWTIFQQRLAEAECCVIILKDKEGKIFGGFSPVPFVPNPKFFGDSRAFVFSSSRLYRATRFNENYTYYNHGQQTLPNGIGFGGQLHYFGWFLSSDFENGQSMAEPTSTTYGNPQLSKSNFFKLDGLEVWCIVERNKDSAEYKQSITQNAEAVAFLEMAGKTMYSHQIGAASTHGKDEDKKPKAD
jgi:hypothetical protein